MPTIASAGNVLVPAYLALVSKGYHVTRLNAAKGETETELWQATNGVSSFIAEDCLSLLGLVAIYETRGKAWKASNEEIDRFFCEFP